MTQTDHILLVTSGILRASGDQLPGILNMVKQSYNLDTPFEPGTVGLGGMRHEENLAYTDWISWLRELVITRIDCIYAAPQQPGLLLHQAAAFAGNTDYILRVITREATFNFALLTSSSPCHILEAAAFITVVNEQPLAENRWQRIGELINESNSLNSRPEIPLTDIADYLLTSEGIAVFDHMAGRLIDELQIEAVLDEVPFVIHESLKHAFYKPQPLFSLPNKDFITLYTLRPVTPGEIIQLLNAQPSEDLIHLEVNKELNQVFPDNKIKPQDAGWPSFLRALSPEDLQRTASAVCFGIATVCTEQNVFPVIPGTLSTAFGPDELEQRRGIIRGRSQDRWLLDFPKQPWRYNYFESFPDLILPLSPDPSVVRQEFLEALDTIKDFSERMETPFTEAFKLARFAMSDAFAPPSGDGQELDKRKTELLQQSFSEHAITVFERHYYITDLHSLGWDWNAVKGLMAINYANVFGGMGSWNDQYFGDDQGEYERVSAVFFEKMRLYFGGILSW